jgi:PAS domain S-box-containing protein
MESEINSCQTILNSVADGVFTVDASWRITSFNRAAECITGLSMHDALGQQCWEVFKADICENRCALRETMKSGKSIVGKTIHIINNQGRRIPVSISTALLKDARNTITGGVETFRDMSEVEELRRALSEKHTFHDIITSNYRMKRIFDMLPSIAHSNETVLILGESGTGKELLAKAIHSLSLKSGGPFIAVNCGALPDNLLESELFGYRKGAFTDAKADKPGRFDAAQGGTLFLDEIGDISKSMQVKLLRVLQEKTYEPLGSAATIKADVRIIAATNRNIHALVETGEFRQDFFYRINILPIQLPTLAERATDIPLLVEHFIARLNSMHHKNISGISDNVLAMLMSYSFPGNIRELENIVNYAFVFCSGTVIEKQHLPEYLNNTTAQQTHRVQSVENFESDLIRETLQRNNFNRSKTATELNINPSTLWRKMKKLGIS